MEESCLTFRACGKIRPTASFTRKAMECFKVVCSVPQQSEKSGVGIPNLFRNEIWNILYNPGTHVHLAPEFEQFMLLLNILFKYCSPA